MEGERERVEEVEEVGPGLEDVGGRVNRRLEVVVK